MSVTASDRKSKKKGGGLKGLLGKDQPMLEEDLLKKEVVVPDDVLRLAKCTESKNVDIFCSSLFSLFNHKLLFYQLK